jgi:hypothetical protein
MVPRLLASRRRRAVKVTGAELSVAIDSYRGACQPLTADEGRILDRLTQSGDAAKAFTALGLSEVKGRRFIKDCVQAHRFDHVEHRTHVERLRYFEKMLAKLEALEKYIGASTEDDVEAVRMMRVALYYRRGRHQYDLLSTSRKGDKASARSRAIGWLKESVRRLSGRPNHDHLMTLCNVVFDKRISLDAVKRAVTPKEWLDKRFSQTRRIRSE